MKRLLVGLVALVIVIAGLGATAFWYVKPAAALDLQYQEISPFAKLGDMVTRGEPVLELSESDINNLLKRVLSEHTQLAQDVVLTGAEFRQSGEMLDAELAVQVYGRVPVGLHVRYQLEANGPVLTARFQEARIRDRLVPRELIGAPDVSLNLNDYIPVPMIGVKQLEFADNGIRVHFGMR